MKLILSDGAFHDWVKLTIWSTPLHPPFLRLRLRSGYEIRVPLISWSRKEASCVAANSAQWVGINKFNKLKNEFKIILSSSTLPFVSVTNSATPGKINLFIYWIVLCQLVKVTRGNARMDSENFCLLKPFISPFRCVISADSERPLIIYLFPRGQIVPWQTNTCYPAWGNEIHRLPPFRRRQEQV